ncbi:MAG: hypothetical protein JW850_09080 [Thermoflexales bacterium]|nr:hypothetical protein [Thermoflexales bacterium]
MNPQTPNSAGEASGSPSLTGALPHIQALPARLEAMADVADRAYAVQARLPLVGPLGARLRRNLTSHLREAYFDPTIERQVIFNRNLARTIEIVWRLVQHLAETASSLAAGSQPPGSDCARHVLDEAARAAQDCAVLNPDLLAGPLPEYGDCLGRDFYQVLYTISLISMPGADQSQHRFNADIITAIQGLAKQIEDYYDQLYTFQNVTTFHVRSLIPDVTLRGYQVRSKLAIIGGLIAWVRRNLTSHLREPYIDPALERQMTFNRLAIDCLRDITAIRPVSLERLEAHIEIAQRGYRVCSDKPIIGPLIARLREALTSHLREPYVVPIFERQAAFNQAVVDTLAVLNQQVTDWRVREQHDALLGKPWIRQQATRLESRVLTYGKRASEAPTWQSNFNLVLVDLIKHMVARVEERL